MNRNLNDPLPLSDPEPVQKFRHVFATGDRVVVLANGKKGKITNIDSFGRVYVTTTAGFVLQCRTEELQPEGFSTSAGADKVEKEANPMDPLPLGPFTKSKKFYRVGDRFQTATGETARVVGIAKGRVHYEFPGGSGFLLQG